MLADDLHFRFDSSRHANNVPQKNCVHNAHISHLLHHMSFVNFVCFVVGNRSCIVTSLSNWLPISLKSTQFSHFDIQFICNKFKRFYFIAVPEVNHCRNIYEISSRLPHVAIKTDGINNTLRDQAEHFEITFSFLVCVE